MTEPTEADRAIFKAAYARVVAANGGCIPTDADEHEIVALQAIGAARMEERAEIARLAQSEEMVEKIARRMAEQSSHVQICKEHTKFVLAALFHETGVSP